MSGENPKEPSEAGEFTRLFGGEKTPVSPDETAIQPTPVPKSEPPTVSARPPQRPPQRPLEKPFADPKAGPGEFTRMFKLPTAPVPSPPVAGNVASPQESEFTRFFKANQLPSVREVDWKEVENRPEQAPEKAPGEFTHLFGRSSQTDSRGPVPATTPTERFAPSVVQVDEFARIIAARPALSQPKAPAVVSEPGPATTQKSPTIAMLLVIITAILMLSGCAIYFLVIRK